jgi:hypothetical protein
MLCKVVLCENYPSTNIPHKNFSFHRYLHFLFFVLLSTGASGWISALYMDITYNFPISCRFQRNSSVPCVNWTISRCWSKAFQDASLRPTRSRMNITFGSKVPITLAKVSDFVTHIIIYCTIFFVKSVHEAISPQNLIWEFIIDRERHIWKEELLYRYKANP